MWCCVPGVGCEGHQSGCGVPYCHGSPWHVAAALAHAKGGANEGLQEHVQPASADAAVRCVPHANGAPVLLHL